MPRERESLNEIIAKNVKALRERVGLSQRQLAVKAKIDPKNVSNLERAAHSPSTDNLAAIATVLSVEPWRLLRPGAVLAELVDESGERLLELYADAHEEDRAAILHVAEMSVAYKKNDPPRGRAEKQGEVASGSGSLQRGKRA